MYDTASQAGPGEIPNLDTVAHPRRDAFQKRISLWRRIGNAYAMVAVTAALSSFPCPARYVFLHLRVFASLHH